MREELLRQSMNVLQLVSCVLQSGDEFQDLPRSGFETFELEGRL